MSVAILQLDIESSTELATEYRQSYITAREKLISFINSRISNINSGNLLEWKGDGGTYIFQHKNTEGSVLNCVTAAIELNHSLILFNTFYHNSDFEINLRFSIDIILRESPKNDPKYSWFCKNEREITKGIHNKIYVTQRVLANSGGFRSFLSEKSHEVKQQDEVGRDMDISIYVLDLDKILENPSFFSLIHKLKKKDKTLVQFFNSNMWLLEQNLEFLYKKNKWKDLLQFREYLTHFFEITGKYEIGVKYGHYFLRAAQEKREIKSQAWILLKDIGWLEFLQGNNEKGKLNFNKAIELFRKENDNEGLSYSYRYLGVYHYMNNECESAWECLNTAKEYADNCDGKIKEYLLARLQNNFGRNYCYQNQYDKALDCFDLSYKLHESLNDDEHKANAKIKMGEAYIKLNKYDDAERALLDGVIWANENSWTEGIGRAKFFLANIFQRNNQRTACMLAAMESEAKFASINNKKWQSRVKEFILKIN